MLVSVSGTYDGLDYPLAGATIDVSEATAEHLVVAGIAEHVAAAAPSKHAERAVAKPAEQAIPARAKARRG
jgi:hypothetical protein